MKQLFSNNVELECKDSSYDAFKIGYFLFFLKA
jgi:hypothetical protein